MRENYIFLSMSYAEDNMVAKAWVSSRVTSAKTRCQSKSIGARYHPLPKTFQKNTYLSPYMEWQNKVASLDGKQPCIWTQDGIVSSTPGHQRCWNKLTPTRSVYSLWLQLLHSATHFQLLPVLPLQLET